MKERPILFNASMVRAILAGDKTQTRRIAKPVRHPDLGNIYAAGALVLEREPQHVIERACPYGRPGDRLWVRESFWIEHDSDSLEGAGAFDCGIDLKTGDWASVCYCADQETAGTWIGPDQYYPERTFVPWGDGGFVPEFFSKRPNIHMPRWASRILLEITCVRVERLQDISEPDALAEGIEKNWTGDPRKRQNGFGTIGWVPDCGWINYMEDMDGEPAYTPQDSFRSLWQSINGRDNWAVNPWVWVVEFRRIKP